MLDSVQPNIIITQTEQIPYKMFISIISNQF